jgi:hypothetical protein
MAIARCFICGREDVSTLMTTSTSGFDHRLDLCRRHELEFLFVLGAVHAKIMRGEFQDFIKESDVLELFPQLKGKRRG